MLQRFQVTVWPDPPATWVNVDRWPDTEAKKRAYIVYERLSQLHLPIAENNHIPAIRFSPEAQLLFNDWRYQLEMKLRTGKLLPALESHLAKYRSLMPSIALILYIIDSVDNQSLIQSISEKYARCAVAWCNYLESHAYRLYSSAQHPSIESARELLKHLQKGDIQDGFSLRDIYRKEWSKLTSPEEVQAAVQVLIEYGWIKLTQNMASKKQIYVLHPSISKRT